MKKYIGIWLDHARSHIVTVTEKNEELVTIESQADNERLSEGYQTQSVNSRDAATEGRHQEKRRQILRRYYQEVIKLVKDAEKIYIFGPGEAKVELEKEIEKCKDFNPRLMAIETADKISENQIMAKVKKVFKPYL
ncbi:MAG: hypothetical protein ACM3SY_12945 [Candidatus Omnitrophota bacterium]